MNRTNQSTVIKAAINSCLEKGLTDKQDIYTTVVTELGVPRPTVRRVARDLRNELLEKIRNDTLSSEDAQELDFIINEFDNEFSDITIDFDNTEVEE